MALHSRPLAGKFMSEHTGTKLSPPKRWINFLPIPYQAEREKRALCNRMLRLFHLRYALRFAHLIADWLPLLI